MTHRLTVTKKFNKYGKLIELQIIVRYISKELTNDEKKKSKTEER